MPALLEALPGLKQQQQPVLDPHGNNVSAALLPSLPLLLPAGRQALAAKPWQRPPPAPLGALACGHTAHHHHLPARPPRPARAQALHIAAFRGHADVVELLLRAGFTTLQKSGRGWSALDEALSTGHADVAALIQRGMAAEVKALVKAKKAQLLATMEELPDYSMQVGSRAARWQQGAGRQGAACAARATGRPGGRAPRSPPACRRPRAQLSWQLDSSVPGIGLLVRRYAPSDTYHIWKVGRRIRVDGALMGIDHAASSILPEWKRGHFSLIYDASGDKARIWFLNRKRESYVDVAGARARAQAQAGGLGGRRCVVARLAGHPR